MPLVYIPELRPLPPSETTATIFAGIREDNRGDKKERLKSLLRRWHMASKIRDGGRCNLFPKREEEREEEKH